MKHRYFFFLLPIGAVVLLAAGWAWVLAAPNPLAAPVAGWLPWPVVCSTRGCITTRTWQRQQTAIQVFAAAAKKDAPSPEQSLTTLARQHLAHYSQLKSPVTPADAVRYREEILNAKNEAQVREATGLSLADYDRFIIIPFLEQESARQQRRAESAEDLYRQLAGERWIFALPFHLTWDKQEAKVVHN